MSKSSINASGFFHAVGRVMIKFVLHILINATYDRWKDHWE